MDLAISRTFLSSDAILVGLDLFLSFVKAKNEEKGDFFNVKIPSLMGLKNNE